MQLSLPHTPHPVVPAIKQSPDHLIAHLRNGNRPSTNTFPTSASRAIKWSGSRFFARPQRPQTIRPAPPTAPRAPYNIFREGHSAGSGAFKSLKGRLERGQKVASSGSLSLIPVPRQFAGLRHGDGEGAVRGSPSQAAPYRERAPARPRSRSGDYRQYLRQTCYP